MAYSCDGEIYLISKTPTGKDNRGRTQYRECPRLVLVQVEDVTRSEFTQVGQLGIQPEYTFVIDPVEYNGERLIEYDGKRYQVYRKYRRAVDELELYAANEVGLNE